MRGTYAGFAMDPVIEHLQRLGVTTVELMPVHAFLDDRHLVERGMRNYWGYNSIGLLLNAYHEEIAFMLPQFENHEYWEVLLDTRDAIGTPDVSRYKAEQAYP